jgi:hypothetical protein
VVDFLPKAKIEVALEGSKVETAIEAIIKAANTGKLATAISLSPPLNMLCEFGLAKLMSKQFKPKQKTTQT